MLRESISMLIHATKAHMREEGGRDRSAKLSQPLLPALSAECWRVVLFEDSCRGCDPFAVMVEGPEVGFDVALWFVGPRSRLAFWEPMGVRCERKKQIMHRKASIPSPPRTPPASMLG